MTDRPKGAVIRVSGPVDEHFEAVLPPKVPVVVMDLGAITRINSFGVKRWVAYLGELAAVRELYFVNCPVAFVDHMNMVLTFCGHAKVITAQAPFLCRSCAAERFITIDVLSCHQALAKGVVDPQSCPECGSLLVLDESPTSYFSFVKAHAATTLSADAIEVLQRAGLREAPSEALPTIESAHGLKLVHRGTTYFKLIGAVDDDFRSRAFREGVSGEVVIDLQEVSSVSDSGTLELSRLFSTLNGVATVIVIDVPEAVRRSKVELGGAAVYSISVEYRCEACGIASAETIALLGPAWPPDLPRRLCSACGGSSSPRLASDDLERFATLRAKEISPNALEVVRYRHDLLSRAQVEARLAFGPQAQSRSTTREILGKYRVVRRLAAGGMAEVYLAVQQGIGGFEKPVALKRIKRQMLERAHVAVGMFLDEARLAARLAHPHIVQTLDVGEEDGELYLAMEYVQGVDLRALLKTLKRHGGDWISLGDSLSIVFRVAQALHYAHTANDHTGKRLNIIHRDVSPSNILIDGMGNVKLTDFGVATSALSLGDSEILSAGKPGYMSPEQAHEKVLDRRTDVFSLGVVLYELCTGTPAFVRRNLEETIAATRAGSFVPPLEAKPALPPALAELLSAMLASDREQRIADGDSVAKAIGKIAHSQGINLSDPLQLDLASLIPLAEQDARDIQVVEGGGNTLSYSEVLPATTHDQISIIETPQVTPRKI